MDRRKALVISVGVLPVHAVWAQNKAQTAIPPSVITTPPRQWGPDAPPDIFPDPDVLPLDDSFNRLIVRYAPLLRLGTGYLWAEGPAWSGEGLYLLFSDVQGDTQYRYIWGTDTIIPFRKPSFNSNGNCFDFQGRQLPSNSYGWEPRGRLDVVVPGDRLRPNGICFSPDYKRVYIISGGIHVGDVAGGKISGLRSFTECMVDGVYCHPDGMRVDRA